MAIDIICRPARRSDAREIARLFRISADGYADYTWSEYAKLGDELLDIGEARFSREQTQFSYQNCKLAERMGVVVGLLHSYPCFHCTNTEEEEAPGDSDPVFQPFIGMEVPQSLYISGLAVHQDWRNLGIGRVLLREAYRRAQRFGFERMSLVCFSSNSMALRFYQRHGFFITKETPIVPHQLIHAYGKALLMVAEKPVKL